MKKAIITGASGLVGRSVVRCLISRGIPLLCLGRHNFDSKEVQEHFGEGVEYIKLDMADIPSLQKKIHDKNWDVGKDCVFYNFAWAGTNRLTDGSFDDQLQNAISSSSAVEVASRIGCSKFINCGTLEETYAESSICNGSVYSSSQDNYAIAKLACRDMCAMVAYLNKIDYIHTRLSAPVSSDLSGQGFIANTLRKIQNGAHYEPAQDNRLYDVIDTSDVAEAYYLLGLYGKNKGNYFIGSGVPTTLTDFFTNFKKASLGKTVERKYYCLEDLSTFSTELLRSHTGFVAKSSKFNFAQDWGVECKKQ